MGPEIDTFYYVRGNVRSLSSQDVSGLTVLLEYSDSDSNLIFSRSSVVNKTDTSGNFDIRDSSFYYYNNHGAVRLQILSLKDTISDTLFTTNANHFEILGEQSGCSSGNSPTVEVYTYPDQTITIP